MNQSFCIVASRECTSGDIPLLRRFCCCENDRQSPEWEKDVQRYIRQIGYSDFDEAVKKFILTTGESGEIFAFAEYGYVEESSVYSISWIARNIKYANIRLGATLLGIVLDEIEIDSYKTDRNNTVITQIDCNNMHSMKMFESFGFVDDGVDDLDHGYHLWVRNFEKHENVRVTREFVEPGLIVKQE